MITITTILWLLSGVVSFLFNLRKIFTLAKDLFYEGEAVFKYVFYALVFVAHVVGGIVSLVYSVYKFFKGA